MSEVLTPAQRRTLPARQALAAKFPSPEAKSAHFRDIGSRGNSGRVTLTSAEARDLATAYSLLGAIAARLPAGAEGGAER